MENHFEEIGRKLTEKAVRIAKIAVEELYQNTGERKYPKIHAIKKLREFIDLKIDLKSAKIAVEEVIKAEIRKELIEIQSIYSANDLVCVFREFFDREEGTI